MEFRLYEYDEDSFLLVLYMNEKYIGYVCVNFNYIAKIWVDSKRRKNGYGSLLLNEAENLIFNKGYDECILDAISPEIPFTGLQTFYIKNNYTQIYNTRFSKQKPV